MIYTKDESEKKTNTDDFGKSNFFLLDWPAANKEDVQSVLPLGSSVGQERKPL